MSIYGSWVSAVVASSGTVSAVADLKRDYEYVNIIIPTQDSATIGLQVGTDPTGSGTLTYQTLGIGSNVTAATTGAVTTTLELGGFQYVKVVSSATQTATRTYYLRGV